MKSQPKIAKTVTPKVKPPINDWYKYIHQETNKFNIQKESK